jgi:hypothetical protein
LIVFKLYVSYILYTNYIVNFSIIKNSNNYKKCIVNNVLLLQNHYDYTSFTLITIIIRFMIELNNHNFLFLFQINIQNIHSNFILIKVIDIIIILLLIPLH